MLAGLNVLLCLPLRKLAFVRLCAVVVHAANKVNTVTCLINSALRKQKVFGMTTSNGKSLCVFAPLPWTTEKWAAMLKRRVVPFLKRSFPDRAAFNILLDGEQVLHGPAAKLAMREGGVTVLPNWPAHSPDLNPQENVWAWAEKKVRLIENEDSKRMSFDAFRSHLLRACAAYPTSSKLVRSMAKRMRLVIENKGGMIKY